MAQIERPDEEVNAVVLALRDRLRAKLQAHFTEASKPVIDAAVSEAMEGLKVAVESYRDPARMRDVMHVILHDKRGTLDKS